MTKFEITPRHVYRNWASRLMKTMGVKKARWTVPLSKQILALEVCVVETWAKDSIYNANNKYCWSYDLSALTNMFSNMSFELGNWAGAVILFYQYKVEKDYSAYDEIYLNFFH